MGKMRSVTKQTADLIHDSTAIGESKHDAKKIGIAKDGIFSFNSLNVHRPTWHRFTAYCKEEFGLRDIQRITPDMLREYLSKKAFSDDLSAKSYENECSRVGKFINALDVKRGVDVRELKTELAECKKFISELRGQAAENRAYLDPKAMIRSIDDEYCKLAAKLQYETGARISEIAKLDRRNLTENAGEIILKNTKGGLERIGKMSPETYEKLLEIITEKGQFRLNVRQYRLELKEAALLCGDDAKGKSTHGFRYNFAQRLYFQLLDEGLSPEMAKSRVSNRLGHKRTEITNRYLRLEMLVA